MKKITYEKKLTLLAAGVTAVFVLLSIWAVGVYFETNDDRCITEILAGIIAPEEDAHAVYINYLLALPLTVLYRFASSVPWYGACLILFQAFCYFCMLESAYSRCGSKGEILGVTFMWGAVYGSNLYLLGQIQFTSTAALLAIAGYVCLLLEKRGKRGILKFALLELAALLLRDQSMLMIQPVGMAAWAGWSLSRGGMAQREKCCRVLLPVVVILEVIAIGAAGRFVGYYSSDWKEYEAYNKSRTELFDYYGLPAYEDCKTILDRYGVTEAEYKAFQWYDNLGGEVNYRCARELAEYARTHQKDERDWKEVLTALVDHVFHGNFRGSNTLMLAACLILAFWILLGRRWHLLWPSAGIMAAEFMVWYFLLWRGRTPERVTLPLFICATSLVLALLLRDYCESQEKMQMPKRIILLALCAVFAAKGISSGRAQYRYVKAENESQKIYMAGMREIQDYCREHPDRKYVIEANSLSYYRGSAFETAIYQPRNSIVAGCWYSNSPSMRGKLKEYFAERQDGIRVILYEDGNSGNHAIIEYLTEKTGNLPVMEEEVTVSNGAVYAVYHFATVQSGI